MTVPDEGSDGDSEESLSVEEGQKQFLLSLGEDQANQQQAARDYLRAVYQSGGATDVDEAVDTIHTHTEYTKSTVRNWYDEISSEAAAAEVTVRRIVKYHPIVPDDDVEWEIHGTADGERFTFKLNTTDLNTQTPFAGKILEVTDRAVEFENWNDTLQGWLDQATIEEDLKAPIGPEWAAAEDVLSRLGNLDIITDSRIFAQTDSNTVLYDSDEMALRANAALIEKAAEVHGDVNVRRIREVLDHVIERNSVTVRVDDDRYRRAWVFDATALVGMGVLSQEHLDAVEAEAADADSESEDTTDDDNDTTEG